MTTSLTVRMALSCAAILAALAAAVYLAIAVPGASRPARDRPGAAGQAQARAMLPVIDAYLDRDAGHLGFGGDLSARLRPRMFCDASIIEIRPAQKLPAAGVAPLTVLWRVGIVMNCGEFARQGHTLLDGSAGDPGIGEVVTVSGGPGSYQARSLDAGPPFWDPSWVHAHFSPGAAIVVLNGKVTAPDPARQARRALGLPPAAPAVQGIQG